MKIGLFVPCYVNAIYPQIGVASYKLLDYLGLDVDYPVDQTCCGQPMANGGFEDEAIALAKHFDDLFAGFDYVVAPSASCAVFARDNHPRLLEKEGLVCHTTGRMYDLCEFLHDVVKPDSFPGKFPHKVSIHNSCHGVRELHLSSASELNIPRYSKIKDLLSLMEGIEIFEPDKVDECCGFGGMFSIEEPAVSVTMGKDKLKNHIATGAEYITGADSSCMMHMRGIADREKLPIRFIHAVEILATGL
ncbi:MAG TPA: Fe-S oxidoreductase [Porphyromonadaceae bacterium]|jgi:L-lactate dehydrogenase complex protein LldE|uniref:(Fe-S)-binding protein n=1 Tax=Limibacterium fermenti TaxID=3229863 RepID=UPI000E805E7E|nr:Fe-S oxidoreductase [Porphyromonadaceae bacterium]HBK31533.1 Fe-S oxidoreductase [Porphyromonadaceae bacterium]HBL33775.1 Fe-S oxidoreductase [Porphyromonadaceae bacterium]HBX19993.1 Fe-S oxidoreductase [Porphyromonadaceae bacterium]HBX45626.1 Fe-S oxidoreductase [Porphyromonadaceae bacterium]